MVSLAMLSVSMLNDVKQSFVRLIVIMLSDVMLIVIILSDVMLIVAILIDVMLIVIVCSVFTGATRLIMTTFSIMKLSIKDLYVTFSILAIR
jgi:hypothetical protein